MHKPKAHIQATWDGSGSTILHSTHSHYLCRKLIKKPKPTIKQVVKVPEKVHQYTLQRSDTSLALFP